MSATKRCYAMHPIENVRCQLHTTHGDQHWCNTRLRGILRWDGRWQPWQPRPNVETKGAE